MPDTTPRTKNLQVGDLVTHVLYGESWIGVIIDFKEDIADLTEEKRKHKALVQIQPETEFDGFFRRSTDSDRINDNLGYVSIHWLFRKKERNGKVGSSRDKTPRSGRSSEELP